MIYFKKNSTDCSRQQHAWRFLTNTRKQSRIGLDWIGMEWNIVDTLAFAAWHCRVTSFGSRENAKVLEQDKFTFDEIVFRGFIRPQCTLE